MDYKHNLTFNQSSASTGTDRRKAAVTGGALGNVTKKCSPTFEIIADTGEVLQFEQREDGTLKPLPDPHKVRALRWQMKSVVNRLLPESRTSKCHLFRSPLTGGGLSGIEVHKTCEHNKAFYTGLMSCGSVWNCPVCAAKISERRRTEMQIALDLAQDAGLKPFLVTLTNSHGIGDDLADIKAKQLKALRKLSIGKNSIKNTLRRQGIDQVGFIRTYEITHGKKNGFHPHFHIIVFIDSDLETKYILDDLKQTYFKRWFSACEKVGLPLPSEKHGVDVKNGDFAARYVTKWGLADEMTKTLHKKSKKDGLSPWGLLQAIFENDNPEYPREYATGLFYAYSRIMGGTRQLFWSVGLRDYLGMTDEIDDETIANQETDETSELLATISYDRWKQIRRSRSEARVLEIAEIQPKLLNEYLTRFDQILFDQDAADPITLELLYPKIDWLSVLKNFKTKSQKKVSNILPLPLLSDRLRLSKILIIPKYEKPA